MRYLSLFSGIEAAAVAWEPLGWVPVAFAEIEPFPCAVLQHYYPGVPNLGDVTAITDEQITALGPIDVVVGGSPCQDLSVAGKGKGLSGARSGLFHEQVRIFHAAHTLCGARWLLWENVPGAFSSNGGRDFAVVVGALAGCVVDVPAKRWGSEGVAVGTHGLVEWCVLDAQWFGVAQRRRRVFAVLDTGDWANRPPVLLEPESLRGDTAPRREAGQRPAGTLAARTRGGGGLGTDLELAGRLQVAHALRAEGFDASEDGTGRGTPLVPDVCPTLRAGGNRTGGDRPQGTDVDTCESLIPHVANPLTARMAKGINTTLDEGQTPIVVPAIAFDARQSDAIIYGDKSGPLDTCGHSVGVAMPTVALDEYNQTGHEEVCYPLRTASGDGIPKVNLPSMSVRRLTPTECARLQGFLDHYLDIAYRGKPAADGVKYKALGNSMAVPCMAWLGRRIQAAHDFKEPT